jgi:hypothetical protein
MSGKSALLAGALVLVLTGCGGGSTPPPPPPPPPVLSVAFSTAPPASLTENFSVSITATVSNDSAAKGVTWSCTPTTPANSCGAFSLSSTASGQATLYTAPSAIPTGGSVTITATSVSDTTKSVSGMTTITAPKPASVATLKGQYAFLIRAHVGNRTDRGDTTFIGTVTLDGTGLVSGGVEDIVASQYNLDRNDPVVPGVLAQIPNTSYYTVDPNGRGTMRIMTQTFNETLDFSFVVTSSSHAEIIETAGEPGVGTLDLQVPTATGFDVSQISGSYAFTLDGVDSAPNPTHKVSLGGVFTADGKTLVTSGTLDVNDSVTGFATTSITGSILNLPDKNTGRGQLHFSHSLAAGKQFVFYIVSPKVLRLVETDGADNTGGSAYAQSAAAAPQTGKFVYQHSGWSTAGRTVVAGEFTTDATGAISAGASDANAGGAPTTPSTGKPTGTYHPTASPATLSMTDAGGASTFNVYPVDPSLNILDPNNSSGGGGALLLHTDAGIVGTGILLPQNVPATPVILAGNAMSLENDVVASTLREVDLVGVFTSDGAGNFTGGVADYDADDAVDGLNTVMLKALFTGTYVADATNAGRFTGSFNIPTPVLPPFPPPSSVYPFIIPGTNVFSVAIYQATQTQSFVIQTDTKANVSGRMIQQQLP